MEMRQKLREKAGGLLFFPLRKNTIDVYYINSWDHIWLQDMMLSLLNAQELEAYYKYLIESRRREYLIGRYLIKTLFGSLLDKKPRDIVVLVDGYGKPYLPEKQFEFNISHSCGMVVCAVSVGKKIGVDIEKIRNDLSGIVERFFSPNEVRHILAQGSRDKTEEEYRLWTMKEAYLKALGKGLNIPLNSFDILAVNDVLFYSLKPQSDYILSVAVENRTKEKLSFRVKGLRFNRDQLLKYV